MTKDCLSLVNDTQSMCQQTNEQIATCPKLFNNFVKKDVLSISGKAALFL
jgi:hypothetical protein